MMNKMKIVVAVDSFKGCVSSVELGEVIADAIQDIFPKAKIVKIPVADGGEGWVDALQPVLGGERITCLVRGPLRNQVRASYAWIEDTKTAVIEMAAASGISLMQIQEGNVMRSTTFGTGELIVDALNRGCEKICLGIGGSATNDAGIGMLQALGFHFRDKEGQEIKDGGAHLKEIADIDDSMANPLLLSCKIEVATDVRNQLYGKYGAAYMFARQKGATDEQIALLDDGLRHLANEIRKKYGVDLQDCPGSGAAGGLGGSCHLFLHAPLLSGISMLKRILHFDETIRDADLIITGEGKIDAQTEQGKLIEGILESAEKYNVPVVAITGNCAEQSEAMKKNPLLAIFSIHDAPVSLEQAMNAGYACCHVRQTIHSVMKLISFGRKTCS